MGRLSSTTRPWLLAIITLLVESRKLNMTFLMRGSAANALAFNPCSRSSRFCTGTSSQGSSSG